MKNYWLNSKAARKNSIDLDLHLPSLRIAEKATAEMWINLKGSHIVGNRVYCINGSHTLTTNFQHPLSTEIKELVNRIENCKTAEDLLKLRGVCVLAKTQYKNFKEKLLEISPIEMTCEPEIVTIKWMFSVYQQIY